MVFFCVLQYFILNATRTGAVEFEQRIILEIIQLQVTCIITVVILYNVRVMIYEA